jgi:hypothetical protein
VGEEYNWIKIGKRIIHDLEKDLHKEISYEKRESSEEKFGYENTLKNERVIQSEREKS